MSAARDVFHAAIRGDAGKCNLGLDLNRDRGYVLATTTFPIYSHACRRVLTQHRLIEIWILLCSPVGSNADTYGLQEAAAEVMSPSISISTQD